MPPPSNPHHELTVEQRLDELEATADGDVAHSVTKDAVKEALTEWLDKKFEQVGKFTVNGVLAMALAALVYFILVHQGWKPAP